MNKELAKSLARLTALKNNIPESSWVLQKYADEFNSILKSLVRISGENLDEFIIPATEIRPRATSWSPSGGTKYSSERYCDKEFILMKIDGVLMYFTLILQETKPIEPEEMLGFKLKKK